MNWAVTDVLTAVLVLITAVYAMLTYGIMRATRASVAAMERQTEELSRPLVTVSPMALPRSFILFLRVSNPGRTAAENLRLELAPLVFKVKASYSFAGRGRSQR